MKLLAVASGSWAPTRHWAAEELRLLGVPEEIPARMAALLSAPTREGIKELQGAVHAWLDHIGISLDRDRMGLTRWAFLTPEGKAAFRTWGAR